MSQKLAHAPHSTALLAAAILAAGTLAGCTSETLFQSNFNTTPIGSPPAATQAIGTASTFGPAGAVVIAGPIGSSTDQWLRVGRADGNAEIAGMQGFLSAMRPPGQFTLSAAVTVPSGSGLGTIQFGSSIPDTTDELPSFLHLDFMQDNTVRIDDNPTTEFGTFPRDQPFDVFVTLNTAVTPATAHISLIGAGATGTTDYNIQSYSQSLAEQFDSVTFWMGFPWTGTFEATDIVVTHATQ